MKKSLIAAAALFAAVAFTACNGSSTESAEAQDTIPAAEVITEEITEITDTAEAPVDSTAAATDSIPAEA